MPYASRQRTTASSLRKYTAKPKRKRASTVAKVRYQRPTAKNQQKQILRNARMVTKLYKAALSSRVFCDWQFVGQCRASVPDPTGFNRDWFCFPLTDYAQWGPVMRRDQNVSESSTTMVDRMVINMRYQLQAASWAQYNVFIVTLRKDSANNDIPARFAAGQFPTAGVEYVEGPDAFNFRLNPAVYKVHYASYKTLTQNTLLLPANNPAGNPFSTWDKGQATVKAGINVRMPVLGQAWTQLPYMQQAYYKRYFMLVAIVSDANAGTTPARTAEFTFDSLATTINDT